MACTEPGADMLRSADVVDRLADATGFEFADLKPIQLRGPSERVRLYRPSA